MTRRLLNLLTALSLLLCVAVCVLWVRSNRWDGAAPVVVAAGPRRGGPEKNVEAVRRVMAEVG